MPEKKNRECKKNEGEQVVLSRWQPKVISTLSSYILQIFFPLFREEPTIGQDRAVLMS
jgi:hypothetical protein